MTKKQLQKYEVIDSNKKAKEIWNKYELNSKDVELLGDFKNEYGELFVVYHKKESQIIRITGDEFGWCGSWVVDIGQLGIYQRFMMSKDELSMLFDIVSSLKLVK